MTTKCIYFCFSIFAMTSLFNYKDISAQTSLNFQLLRSGISSGAGSLESTSYKLKESAFGVVTSNSASSASYILNAAMIITEIRDSEQFHEMFLPQNHILYQNYPNPFNPKTRIAYALPKAANVSITIYNILGNKIKTFDLKKQGAGYYSIIWDGKDDSGVQAPSGAYIYRIIAGEFVDERKLLLIK